MIEFLDIISGVVFLDTETKNLEQNVIFLKYILYFSE